MQEKLIQNYLKHRSNNYYQKFWAGTALENGLSINIDGKEIMIKPEKIFCNDLGEMVGTCKCGHAIRYEYWLDDIGPIGSTCIGTITGLQGEDLRNIIRGGDLAKKDAQEARNTIERYKTFKNQLESNVFYKEAYEYLLNNCPEKIPEIAKDFINADIPTPWEIRREIQNLYRQHNVSEKIINEYGQNVYDSWSRYEQTYQIVENLLNGKKKDLQNYLGAEDNFAHETMKDIGEKITNLKATEKAAIFFMNLEQKLNNPRFSDALDVLVKLWCILLEPTELEKHKFWADIVVETIPKALKYGLTENQISFILNKSSSGKPGLALRFAEKLQQYDKNKEAENNKFELKPTPKSETTDSDEFLDFDVSNYQ